jgi:hypothetical protein
MYMTWSRLICLAVAASQWAASGAAADRAAQTPDGNTGSAKVPPVMRPSEPRDSGQVTLPGAPSASSATGKITLPSPASSEPASKLAPSPAKPGLPPEAGREVAAYCQQQIGHWKESDARKLLGESKRRRPAYDEKKSVNGYIYAYTDPTNKYKELELDFDRQTGTLRTVFVYPPRLTWEQCRRLWDGPVAAANAARGRKFYSYTNRRLDVLVDSGGKVISLGWY